MFADVLLRSLTDLAGLFTEQSEDFCLGLSDITVSTKPLGIFAVEVRQGEGKTTSDNKWVVEFTPEDGFSGYTVTFKDVDGTYYDEVFVEDNGLIFIAKDTYLCVVGLCNIQFELEGTECKKIVLTGELESLFGDYGVGDSISLTLVG